MAGENEIDPQVTAFLQDWPASGNEALIKLFPLVMEDLRNLARVQFRRERSDHTLQPTALVNECYLRLLESDPIICQDREHFYALAARIMRRVLVDHARRRNREKRPDSAERADIALDDIAMGGGFVDILALDQALSSLWEIDADQARTAELRFFAGLTFAEIATVLGATERTAQRKWNAAKKWLHRSLTT